MQNSHFGITKQNKMEDRWPVFLTIVGHNIRLDLVTLFIKLLQTGPLIIIIEIGLTVTGGGNLLSNMT